MGFEVKGEAVIAAHEFADLKLVYRALHECLAHRTELMDTAFLIELQDFLHAQAQADGVDIGDHGAWDTWLGHQRNTSRRQSMRDHLRIEPDKA